MFIPDLKLHCFNCVCLKTKSMKVQCQKSLWRDSFETPSLRSLEQADDQNFKVSSNTYHFISIPIIDFGHSSQLLKTCFEVVHWFPFGIDSPFYTGATSNVSSSALSVYPKWLLMRPQRKR